MAQLKTFSVNILNKTYEIKGPESEEAHLFTAAQKLNDHLLANKIQFKKLDDYQALLLAALKISHELILCKNDQEHQRFKVTQFITSLESKINKTVGGDSETVPQTD
jgi:cell division protein ZapA